jgi:hypothetical protein
MKILNRKQFLALKEEVLYTRYDPCCFNGLEIKHDTISDPEQDIDFYYQNLIAPIETSEDGEYHEKCEQMEKGIDIELNFNDPNRDACYEEEEMYAIYSQEDIKQLISKLNELIK